MLQSRLARWRVPLGFACTAISMVLARPTPLTLAIGGAICVIGEAVRVWASGHIEKGREVTRSGPYRLVPHPLYLGSAIIGLGFVVAARSVWAAVLVIVYLAATLLAAMRSEEATLDARFADEYQAYRAGRAEPVDRVFSFARLSANREYRAIAGLALGMGLLYLRSLL